MQRLLQIVFLLFWGMGTLAQAQIIPQPASTITLKGSFKKPKSLLVYIPQTISPNEVNDHLVTLFGYPNLLATPVKTLKEANVIVVIDSQFKSEQYRLSLGTPEKKKIEIRCRNNRGLLYALTSLQQLYYSQKGKSLAVQIIDDQPRFAYRGMHLDVCRHFFPTSFILKYLDMMAYYKFNTFHWHLTEDQAWRIEIKKYPKLTEIGAFRKGTQYGRYSDQTFDTLNYGGFYTQTDIKMVVEYARVRGITVIPEIEMPGHALAALSAYPEFSCTGGPFSPAKGWGVFDDVYCAGNDQTFEFLQNIIDEVIALFPNSPYIHIGGDECPKTRWKTCPKCQKRMKDMNLADEHALQSYFITRMEKYINSKGKNIIGWDEILEGGLAPNATVMSWRGSAGGIAAAQLNHQAIMTPGKPCYFDHYQYEKIVEPIAIGGFNPIDSVYFYDPIPSDLSAEQQSYILGAQGNVWTEYMPNEKQVEYMVLPRAVALAEVLWSPKGTNGRTTEADHGKGALADLVLRIQTHIPQWQRWDWNYCDRSIQIIYLDSTK